MQMATSGCVYVKMALKKLKTATGNVIVTYIHRQREGDKVGGKNQKLINYSYRCGQFK